MTSPPVLATGRLAASALRDESDERLVELVRAGCDQAFEVIVGRYTGPLKSFVRRLLPDPHAEDVVQQTFVRAVEALRSSDSEILLRPWLYRIAHNAALDTRKARGFSHEQLDERTDGVERPDQAFERRERLREVVAAIRSLPVRQRQALVLRELEGRSYDEIAVQLHASDGAVRQLLLRARARVRSAASALTPISLFSRLPWQGTSESVSSRVLEFSGTVATGAIIAKVGVTAIAASSIVGAPMAATGDESRATPAPAYAHVASLWARASLPAPRGPDAKAKHHLATTPRVAHPPLAPSAPGQPTRTAPTVPAAAPHTSPAATAPNAPAAGDNSGPGATIPLYCGAAGLNQVADPEGLRVLSEQCGGSTPPAQAPAAEQPAPADQGQSPPPSSDSTGPSGAPQPGPAESQPNGDSTTPSPPPPAGP